MVHRLHGHSRKLSTGEGEYLQLFQGAPQSAPQTNNRSVGDILRIRRKGFFSVFKGQASLQVALGIEAATTVLNETKNFSRSGALEEFRDAFKLDSVFTTYNKSKEKCLRRFFARHVNGLDGREWKTVLHSLDKKLDEKISLFPDGASIPFVNEIESATFSAYAEAFFDMPEFPEADKCVALIKEVWRLKSLRNNIYWHRFSPYSTLKYHVLRHRLLKIVETASRQPSYSKSRSAEEMSREYRTHECNPGSILNAMIPLYEAISRGVVAALLALAQDSSLQLQLRDEIDKCAKDRVQYLTSKDTLLHRIWLETLRVFPPTPNQTRRVLKENTLGLKPGSKVVVLWSVFHLDPVVWGGDAHCFLPERWLDPSNEQLMYYNPYGKGAQRCVAEEYGSFGGKAMIAKAIQDKRISLLPGCSIPTFDRGYSRGPDPDTTIVEFHNVRPV